MKEHSNLYFLLLFLTTIVAVALMIKPFAGSILLAVVLAILFKPLYRYILRGIKIPSLAAVLTIIIVLVAVITPLTLVGWQAGLEANDLYNTYLAREISSESVFSELIRPLTPYLERLPFLQSIDIESLGGEVTDWLITKIAPFATGIFKTLLGIVILMLALFFLLRDSLYFRTLAQQLMPLTERETNVVISKLSLAVTSIVRGSLLVSLLQGILTSIGLTIFGVPRPVLWGLTAAFASLIPGVGTALVLTPAIIFTYFSVGLAPALGLLVWGVIAVGLVDNFLGPYLVGRGMSIHPLLILLSVLGGISFFGAIGFLAGPLMLALLLALLPLYHKKID